MGRNEIEIIFTLLSMVVVCYLGGKLKGELMQIICLILFAFLLFLLIYFGFIK